jgi:hypothetical protein
MVLPPSGPRAALLALALAGCGAPLQNGGVVVYAGADQRIELLCRWHPGPSDACGPPDEPEAEGPLADEPAPDEVVVSPEGFPAAATSAPARGAIPPWRDPCLPP